MKRPKIKDCLPLVNGLWHYIDYQFPEIFDISSSQLDVLFLSNWSMRTAAPLLNVLHDDEDSTMLTTTELENLAGIVNGMYKHKWDKMMAVAEMEYDPIHNFSDHLIESVEYGEEIDRSKSSSSSRTGSRTDNLSEVTTDARQVNETRNLATSGSNSNENGVFGFNSSVSVGANDSSGSNSGTETGTIATVHSGNLTTANTGTQSTAGSNTYSESSGDDTAGTKDREYTKTGNIGNISTQKLMNEELDLWRYNFICEMMQDVVKLISLPIYEQ